MVTRVWLSKIQKDAAYFTGWNAARATYHGQETRRWEPGNIWRGGFYTMRGEFFREVFGVRSSDKATRDEVGKWFRAGFRASRAYQYAWEEYHAGEPGA